MLHRCILHRSGVSGWHNRHCIRLQRFTWCKHAGFVRTCANIYCYAQSAVVSIPRIVHVADDSELTTTRYEALQGERYRSIHLFDMYVAAQDFHQCHYLSAAHSTTADASMSCFPRDQRVLHHLK